MWSRSLDVSGACQQVSANRSLGYRLDLEAHHNIEERHIFPVLAQRMPEFREDEKHRISHKQIHDGLDVVNLLVAKWKDDPSTYKPDELRAALDSFREPLYRHLAEEVYVD